MYIYSIYDSFNYFNFLKYFLLYYFIFMMFFLLKKKRTPGNSGCEEMI